MLELYSSSLIYQDESEDLTIKIDANNDSSNAGKKKNLITNFASAVKKENDRIRNSSLYQSQNTHQGNIDDKISQKFALML